MDISQRVLTKELRAADFPDDFLWGVATSSYQIEGAVNEGGRGPSIWDTFSHASNRTFRGATGDVAADHFHRYREDVALMAELGVTAYRFSLSWSRLLPTGTGAINPEGVAFYRSLCTELLAAGITPLSTLYHWDLPQELQDLGGWLNPESPRWFAEYAAVAKDALGDLVRYWATLNEPWCSAFLGHSSGEHAPGIKDSAKSLVAAHHLMLAHHAAIAAMRSVRGQDDDRLGIVLNLIPAWPAADTELDAAAAGAVDAVQNRLFLQAVLSGTYPDAILNLHRDKGVADSIDLAELKSLTQPIDLLGVNYYNVNYVEHRPGAPEMASWPGSHEAAIGAPPGQLTEMGWGVEPEGLSWMLNRVAKDHPGIPMMVTENGAAYPDEIGPGGVIDDQQRIAYIASHIAALRGAMDDGADVRGYFLWSLLDNFEWTRGYSKRFGIVAVDFESQRRTMKASGRWYRDFLRS